MAVIADRDGVVSQMMATFLGEHDFDVVLATTGAELDTLLRSESVDIVLTAPILADGEALGLLRQRETFPRPAVIVVSDAAELADRVVALELGADDFVMKPYNPREVLARIRAILRGRAMLAPYSWSTRYRFATLIFNAFRSDLSAPSGASERLTTGEAALLMLLLASPRKLLDRTTLGIGLATAEPLNGRAVDVRVSRLRRKLNRLGAGHIIRTEHGLGYALAADVTRL